MSSFRKRPPIERFIVRHNGEEQISYNTRADGIGGRSAYQYAAMVAARYSGEIWSSYDDPEAFGGRVIELVKSYRKEGL